jgi:hypothetical protein
MQIMDARGGMHSTASEVVSPLAVMRWLLAELEQYLR